MCTVVTLTISKGLNGKEKKSLQAKKDLLIIDH